MKRTANKDVRDDSFLEKFAYVLNVWSLTILIINDYILVIP